MNLDTKYLSEDIAKDVQFIKDNLTNDDVNMIRAQLQFIMSVGDGRLEERKDS